MRCFCIYLQVFISIESGLTGRDVCVCEIGVGVNEKWGSKTAFNKTLKIQKKGATPGGVV